MNKVYALIWHIRSRVEVSSEQENCEITQSQQIQNRFKGIAKLLVWAWIWRYRPSKIESAKSGNYQLV